MSTPSVLRLPTIEPQWLKCETCGDVITMPGCEEWPEADFHLQPWQRVSPPDGFSTMAVSNIAGAKRFVPDHVEAWLIRHAISVACIADKPPAEAQA